MTAIWAGIDAGRTHHQCVVIDDTGKRLLSRRVANDEPELLKLPVDVLALGDEVIWGIDLADGGAALLIDLLLNHGQHTLYIPGRAVSRASEGYRGRRQDRRQGRRDHRRPGPDPPGPATLAAGRRTRRRDQDSHRPSHEHRPAGPADRLPDASRHPQDRCQEAGDLAEQPQGPRCCSARRRLWGAAESQSTPP